MHPIQLGAKTSALIVIDLQHGIVAIPASPYPAADVITRCASLAENFRAQGAPVIYVRVDLANFRKLMVDSPMRDPNGPPPPPTASEIVPEAGLKSGDLVITKRHWSAFLDTDLEQRLRDYGVQTVVLGGISTNYGVESTARDAAGLGFDVVLVEDAMASRDAKMHQFAVEMIFPRLGRVRKAAFINFTS